jgi:hypothetical protein
MGERVPAPLSTGSAHAEESPLLSIYPSAERPRYPREKVFGPGRAVPLDRNAKARIEVYVKNWNARNKQPRQHCGPITRTFLQVLEALLWGFHNSRSGACFPSYEAIADWVKRKYGSCARSTVAEALKALEWSGILTWQNRITHMQVRERDLFGKWSSCWRVIRTSNAYIFRDPGSKSENSTGTPNQDSSLPLLGRPCVRERKKEERIEGSAAALAHLMRAASALPDLLRARREELTGRWRAAMRQPAVAPRRVT